MKLIGTAISLVLCITLLACQEKKNTTQASPKKQAESISSMEQQIPLARFDWILGKHIRTNSEPGVKNQEFWTRKKDNAYQGLALTTREDKSKVDEVMTLISSEQGLNFVVQQGGHDPVTFKVVDHTDNSFTCTNQENDYPKRIHYEMRSSGLYAIISGGGPEQEFFFSLQ